MCDVAATKGWFNLTTFAQDFYVLYVFLLFYLQSESKREEFRRYLEGAGVLDAFTKGDKGLV